MLRAPRCVVRGKNLRRGGSVELSHPDVQLEGTLPPHLKGAQSIAAVLPRNRIKVSLEQRSSGQRNAVRGTVERIVFTGSVFNIYVRVSERLELRVALTTDEVARLGQDNLSPGLAVELHWRPEDIVLVADSEIADVGP